MRQPLPERTPINAAHQADHHRFDEELQQDRARRAPDGFAQADLARALRDARPA
jgi:hypothetical protein